MTIQPQVSVGDRVRLICCTDKFTRLGLGDEGTVRLVDGMGTVHVNWDSGSTLGLIAEAGDEWEHIACAWPRRNGGVR